MEQQLYRLNSSQEVIRLQTKYTLFKRVENILFSVTFEGGFDQKLMTDAINLLIERNDCLRITFVQKGGETFQYFVPERFIGQIPFRKFDSIASEQAFVRRFRRNPVNCYKGRPLEVVYAENVMGESIVYFKISHYVADTYGIGVLVGDLFGIYDALLSGRELPTAPGSFEKVLAKDCDYTANDELRARDEQFFEQYYKSHAEPRPIYCGIHGNHSDGWLRQKRKGAISMPFYFVKCDTKGYRMNFPAILGRKAEEWCAANQITPSTFYYYTLVIATSLVNDRARHSIPLLLLDCRGTLAERRAAGTKVQPLSIYETVDYDRSFNDSIRDAFNVHQELYKHTRLRYREVEILQHKVWNFSMMGSANSFAFSYVQMSSPKGATLQILSNGKGSLRAYIAVMANPSTGGVTVVYDIQTEMIEPEILADFHNTYMNVIESVLESPDAPMKELF